jgi:hypothetical protein
MGVDYFSCENCREASSEYNEIYCEKCESRLCDCVMPDELSKLCGCWDDAWYFITTDGNNNIIKAQGCKEDYTKLFKKYCSVNDDYGLVLKEEYCPICQREKENKEDPEYKEYLRLKAKFEK